MKNILEKVSLLSLSLMLVSTFSPSPALPQMIAHFQKQGYPVASVELLFSIPSFTIIAVLLITPWLSRKLSERFTIVLGLLFLSFGGSLPLVGESYRLLVCSRILLGIGIGLINVRAISIISETYKGRGRIQMLGFRASFEVLGNAVLTAIVGALLKFGWSSAFSIYLFGLPILAFYLLFSPKSHRLENEEQEVFEESHPAKLSKQELVYILGLALLAAFAINVNSANSLRIPILVNQLGIGTPSQASLLLSVMMLMGILAGACFSDLSSRFGKFLIPLSFILFSISLLMIGMAQDIWLIAFGAMLSGLIYSIIVTASFSSVSEHISVHLIGGATTLILVFCNLGGASASFALNFFSKISPGLSSSFLIYAALSLVIGLGILWKSLRQE